jgi:succinyl-CoA synthetase alpha subunit
MRVSEIGGDKTMGYAGAIISGSSGTAQVKEEALEARDLAVGGA